MPEIVPNIEQAAKWFEPVVLVAPGAAALLLGLIIWLGGLGFRRFLAAVIGAVATAACGFLVIDWDAVTSVGLAVLVAVIAAVIDKVFIVILAAALAAGIGFAILAKPYFEEPAVVMPTEKPTRLTVEQSLDVVKTYISDCVDEAKQVGSQMPLYNLVILGGLGVIFLAGGFIFWNSVSALCCATLGTILVFGGMILLLLYKGAEPITNIGSDKSFYSSVFMAMVLSGTALQLLLFRQGIKKQTEPGDGGQAEGKETGGRREKPKSGWRNR